MSVESNFEIALVLHCYALWLAKNLAPLHQPRRSKTETIVTYSHPFSRAWRRLRAFFWMLWLAKNLAPFSQPIRRKTETNRNLLACVFWSLTPATCISFEFWLVHLDCMHLLWLATVITYFLCFSVKTAKHNFPCHWFGHVSNHDGSSRHETTGLLGEKNGLCTCLLHFCAFVCRSLQNNNFKWPN